MDLHLSHHDGVPVYQQIVQQVKHLIASGRLGAGKEMPPIRKLAEQLLINPNTVARAYRELESSGWVFKRRGAGTYVADRISPLSALEKQRLMENRANALLAEAHQMNVPLEQVIELIKKLAQQTHPAQDFYSDEKSA
ncbi:MAG: GntR family transcriptional regulator [Lysobacterales bacterium]